MVESFFETVSGSSLEISEVVFVFPKTKKTDDWRTNIIYYSVDRRSEDLDIVMVNVDTYTKL